MSQHAAELCALVVDDVYGQLTSRVYSALLRVGRVPILALAQQTDLQPRQLRHALAVLIQQHLVRHYTDLHSEITFYEADWKAAYGLIRSGKFRRLVDEAVNPASGAVLSNLLLLGHTRVRDLLSSYSVAAGKTAGKGPGAEQFGNGDAKGEKLVNGDKPRHDPESVSTETKELQHNLRTLLDTGFITHVRSEHFRPSADAHAEAEGMMRDRYFPDGVKGSKQQALLNEHVRKKLKEWRDDDFRPQLANGVKRHATDSSSAGRAKRLKLDASAVFAHSTKEKAEEVDDDEDHKTIVDQDLIVRANEDKCLVVWRNQRLMELAERRVGAATSVVYKNFLELVTEPVRRCRDDLERPVTDDDEPEDSPSISTFELYKHIDPDIDLASSVRVASKADEDAKPLNYGQNKRKRRRTENGTVDVIEEASPDEREDDDDQGDLPEVEHDSADENPDGEYGEVVQYRNARMHHINTHLELLAEDSHHFVQPTLYSSDDRWTVDFPALVISLKNLAIDDIVRSRWDQTASRVVRILREKGKLDERQLANVALVPAKQIRILLSEMHEAGYLELQEVPRDNTRQVSRTFYLWFFDLDRCTRSVLEDLYKCLARLMQRSQVERDKIKALLEKSKRTDVVGMEDKYLTQQEREELKRWRDTEERLLVQIERVDDLVAVFRDF